MNTDIPEAYKAVMTDSNEVNSIPQAYKDVMTPDSSSSIPKAYLDMMDPWQSFVEQGSQIASQRGFPKNVLLGQAAIESGRGTSNFAKQRNNYFGIGAFDSNPNNAYGYNSPAENINKYIDLVTSYPGVKEAIASGDSGAVIRAIKAAGYATDPNYVTKVMSTPEFGGSN